MAIIQFTCDTCKRTIDLQQNREGIDTFGRCIITDGCKGKLHQVKVKPDQVIGQLTPDAAGLNNWIPRKILYDHYQPLSATQWIVKHNLNGVPSVQVFVYKTEEDFVNDILTEITPDNITVTDPNNLLITFTLPQRGVAQCIARSTDEEVVVASEKVASELKQITMTAGARQYMTIATLTTIDDRAEVNHEIQFLSPTTFKPITPTVNLAFTSPFGRSGELTPWYGVERVLIGGKTYTLRTAEVKADVPKGSAFYFIDPPKKRDTFIMLAKAPYTEYDRILDKIIDLNNVNENTAAANTIYRDGQLFISDSLWESIYPTIRFI